MKSCQDVDTLMTAYVDGETGGDETVAVEAHLRACPPCRERAAAEKVVRTVTHTKASTLGERASPGLRARCIASASEGHREGGGDTRRAARSSRRLSWVPLSMAATVLLAVGAVFFIGQNNQLEAAFAAQLALDHDRCFGELEEVVAGFDPEQAETILAREFGLEVTVPAESADFDLLDVRQCLYDDGEMAHVLGEWRGQPVSLFVVPGRSDRGRILEIIGHDAVIWSEGNQTFVLVAEQGPAEIGQVAEYVRQFTD